MKNILIWVLRFTWELPQTFLGFLVWVFSEKKGTGIYKGSFVTDEIGFGVSLGAFIFVIPSEALAKIKEMK